jgi:hypothetical protein
MTLPSPISSAQVAPKAPIDTVLVASIKADLEYLDSGVAGISAGVLDFKLNGNLGILAQSLPYRRFDGAFVAQTRTLTAHGLYLEIPGLSGTLEADMRKYRRTGDQITSIAHLYQGSVNSITLAGAAANTQSITKATPQVNTQSIAVWKATINISSIIATATANQWRINLATQPDTDWIIGDSILVASATSGGNNGTFVILAVNVDGGANIIVTNASGVAQTSAAGTVQLQAFKYVLTNPASSDFVAGEQAIFASHTTGANNGTLTIYATNQGGNDIIVKNPTGATQGAAAGTIDSSHWQYNFSGAAGADLVIGELAAAASHSTGANNGNFRIVDVNRSGNNIVLYNTAGATQGGAAGTINSNRWIYALASDPSGAFTAGDRFIATGCTDSHDNCTALFPFTVVQVNRSATNNLVIVNTAGVAQGGAAGTVTHTKKLVSMPTDQHLIYVATTSRIFMRNTPDSNYAYPNEFTVLQVNRGGGSNWNVVIDCPAGSAQANPEGNIAVESRSVFSTRPKITVVGDLQNSTNGVLDTTEKVVAAGVMLAPEVLQVPSGTPQNMTFYVA